MKPTITISSLSVLLACLTLSAQEAPGRAGRFKQLDKDGDGKITPAEMGNAELARATQDHRRDFTAA
jgi:hypothetical protein